MGSLAHLLFRYNQLRSPRSFVYTSRHAEALTRRSLGPLLRVWTNGVLALTFKSDKYVSYLFTTPRRRLAIIKWLTYTAPTLFLFTPEEREGSVEIFEESFRLFKRFVKPLIYKRDFMTVSSRYKRFLRFPSLRRGVFFCLLIEEFFLTYNSRFVLSMNLNKWLTPWAHFYLCFFKLVVHDYNKLKWGLFNYPQYRTLSYYRALGALRKRIRNRALFYADGLLDYLDEEDFPELLPIETEETLKALEPEGNLEGVTPMPLSGEVVFYARNSQENKGRYARNRQTYRTGVIWCLWLTVFTIALPSYLWYGITVKFTYLWPLFIGGVVSTFWAYYSRTRRWSFWQTTDLVVRACKWLEK